MINKRTQKIANVGEELNLMNGREDFFNYSDFLGGKRLFQSWATGVAQWATPVARERTGTRQT